MHPRLTASLLVAALAWHINARAQPPEYSSPDEAVSALYPGQKLADWGHTTGDFNEDGIQDLAVLLTLFQEDTPVQTRLVVLAGTQSGRYAVISASARYCNAQKFFNLETRGSSLFVSAVHKADARESASETLQFIFNRHLNDLELVGRENVWESYSDESYGRLSVNFRSGTVVEYAGKHGRVRETRRSKFAALSPKRLQGFDCENRTGSPRY